MCIPIYYYIREAEYIYEFITRALAVPFETAPLVVVVLLLLLLLGTSLDTYYLPCAHLVPAVAIAIRSREDDSVAR